jgi:hypothetical protein
LWYERKTGAPTCIGTPVLYFCEVNLEGLYVRGLQTLGALDDFEFNRLAIVQRLVAISHNSGEMDENVLTALALNEPKALAGIEPLHCTLFFTHCFTLSLSRVAAEHCIKLSDAPSPEPLNRAAAVFKLRPADRKAIHRTKK